MKCLWDFFTCYTTIQLTAKIVFNKLDSHQTNLPYASNLLPNSNNFPFFNDYAFEFRFGNSSKCGGLPR